MRPIRAVVWVFFLALALLLFAVLFTTSDADAAVGKTCVHRAKTIKGHSLGFVVWKFYASADACYWNDHSGVASYEIGSSGWAAAPYDYVGQIGHWRSGGALCERHRECTHSNNHQYGEGVKGKVIYCLPLVGCQPIAYPWIELGIDSYGNWFVHTG